MKSRKSIFYILSRSFMRKKGNKFTQEEKEAKRRLQPTWKQTKRKHGEVVWRNKAKSIWFRWMSKTIRVMDPSVRVMDPKSPHIFDILNSCDANDKTWWKREKIPSNCSEKTAKT